MITTVALVLHCSVVEIVGVIWRTFMQKCPLAAYCIAAYRTPVYITTVAVIAAHLKTEDDDYYYRIGAALLLTGDNHCKGTTLVAKVPPLAAY